MSHLLLDIRQNRRRLDLENDFFAQGNFERYKAFLQRFRNRTMEGSIGDNDSFMCVTTNLIICSEVGCSQVFSSLRMFEEHKFRCHGHQCSLCNKSFAADRLLSFHISEIHDSYFAVASKKKPMYCCLVATCQQVFWNDEERRMHLIQSHMFHPSYDFHNPKKFLKKFKSKLQPKVETAEMTMSCNSKAVLETTSTNRIETQQPPVATNLNRAQRRAAKFNTAGAIIAAKDTAAVTSSGQNPATTNMEVMETLSASTKSLNRNDTADTDNNDESMEIDDDLEEMTSALRTTNIQVPSKISFGRRRGHH